jgi:hypothetical protein
MQTMRMPNVKRMKKWQASLVERQPTQRQAELLQLSKSQKILSSLLFGPMCDI